MSESRGRHASGEFSQDPTLDPSELFDVISREENVSRVLAAMRQFLSLKDTSLFERAVAVYVRSARARGEPVEAVLAALQSLADELERDSPPGFARRDTPMRYLVLRGVLLAFYGPDTVATEAAARNGRVERQGGARPDAE